MPSSQQPRFVIDTNVLFEGVTQKGSASGMLVDAWLAELFTACVSTTLTLEYDDVLNRKLSPAGYNYIAPLLTQLIQLAEIVNINFSWRPISPDPGDDHIIDCAMNANAIVVTSNLKDFRAAEKQLELIVLSPIEALQMLLSD